MRLTRFLILPLLGFLTACSYVGTENFLDAPGDTPLDTRLIGNWVLYMDTPDTPDKPGDVMLLQIGRVGPDTDDTPSNLLRLTFLMMEYKASGTQELAWAHLTGHTTHLGDRRYLNLRGFRVNGFTQDEDSEIGEVQQDDPLDQQILFYQLQDPNTLILGVMDEDYVKVAAEQGLIAAEEPDEDVSTADIRLTAKPKALRKFIKNAPADQLFRKLDAPLKRVMAPAPPANTPGAP